MEPLTKSQKARIAVRTIKTTVDALVLRGYYKPSGKSGKTLTHALRMLSPEIYGCMNDARIMELKGLEYVIERLPMGIEKCNRIILTAQEEFENTSFEKIIPPKRRRASYLIGEKEICFVITRGSSEIYDILTHITFLNIEANKIASQIYENYGNNTREWSNLKSIIKSNKKLEGDDLDRALWNLSILMGRTLHEAKDTYNYLEKYSRPGRPNVLMRIIYGLGKRVDDESKDKENELLITFTPSLQDIIGNQSYSRKWATKLKKAFYELDLQDRPIHIISANLHSVINLIFGYNSVPDSMKTSESESLYDFINKLRKEPGKTISHALKKGLYEIPDESGTNIDCQIIDTAKMQKLKFHPDLNFKISSKKENAPVIMVMDYAFGTQAFEAIDELLKPYTAANNKIFNIQSISVMGKAGILTGGKGDIMLATSHVFEGTSGNYPVKNDVRKEDFDNSFNVYTGPIVTVVGTSLQNRDLLKRFRETSWKAIGLEMEGGHYQKAISSAIIRGHISKKVKTRYAYYASDNPLESGQTLASGSMGEEGIRPTYAITKVILEKIFNGDKSEK